MRVHLFVFLALFPVGAAAKAYVVSGDAGNSTMGAVFDAPLGERIQAVSSAVSCTLDVDPAKGIASGRCSVPLTSITVDSNPTKTEHFYEWATNKKADAKTCNLDLTFANIKAEQPLEAQKPAKFALDAAFTVCGKANGKGAKERIEGTVLLMPAGTYGSAETLRIRARIEKFSRDDYQVGPKYTTGWLARVQQLANVVADTGTIEVNLFARAQ